ncbi:hypothetical protein [Corynebacterium afermentans]|uniref:hypothetical protein n=1 Tax=Corynebacterium afermentans TaxID=38286 RepID=UPI001178877F|nr:hypothetical protein [Corynebacterium afermentans]
MNAIYSVLQNGVVTLGIARFTLRVGSVTAVVIAFCNPGANADISTGHVNDALCLIFLGLKQVPATVRLAANIQVVGPVVVQISISIL